MNSFNNYTAIHDLFSIGAFETAYCHTMIRVSLEWGINAAMYDSYPEHSRVWPRNTPGIPAYFAALKVKWHHNEILDLNLESIKGAL